ncbi:MAG: hypothetical protein NTV32_08965 [Gammaproteobacteria bacterium]|nr:hypothetical protein [Gammaproteobacteria bacterium]
MRRILQMTALGLGLALCLPVFAWQDIVVKKTDTLNALAVKYRPANVSTMDMVIAIRHANPELVSHALRASMHLRIPTTGAEVRQAITSKAQHIQSKEKPKSATKLTLKASAAAPVKAIPHDPALLAKMNADKLTIASLQEGINSQIQTIQSDQAQITDLTAKLALANQAASSVESTEKTTQQWAFGDLFFPIFVVTLFLYLRLKRKYKAKMHQHVPHVPHVPHVSVPSAGPCEPNFTGASLDQAVESSEPDLLKGEATDWQQVELDIPESDVPIQANIRLEPLLTTEEKEELVGEQQNIINAISNDHENIDWHMALLEFYTKTNNENGYQRHYQNMLRSGLMREGDRLWETVRKIYLNHWVYRTEGV